MTFLLDANICSARSPHAIRRGAASFCPGGALDGSPAIYRWVSGPQKSAESPGGTAEIASKPTSSVVPSGLRTFLCCPPSQH